MGKRHFIVIVLVLLFCGASLTTFAQSPERPEVISAVAPFYPQTFPPNISGSVQVEVTVDSNGAVLYARALNGHPLLQPTSIRAAKLWRFARATSGTGERRTRLMFGYQVVPKGTPENELWPVYKPPYVIEVKQVEVKAREGRRR